MNIKNVLSIIAILILGGCTVSKDLYNSWKPELAKGGKLQEISEYNSIDTTNYYSLWQYLESLKTLKNPEEKDSLINSWVRLECINDKTIKAFHYLEERIIDSMQMVGRYDGEYFITNQSHKKVLIPLIYYKNLNTQFIIFNDSIGNLVIHELTWNEGAVLIFGGNGGGFSTNTYKKRKKT